MSIQVKALVAAKQTTPEIIGDLHSLYYQGHLMTRAEKFVAIKGALAKAQELVAAVQAAHDEIVSPIAEAAE